MMADWLFHEKKTKNYKQNFKREIYQLSMNKNYRKTKSVAADGPFSMREAYADDSLKRLNFSEIEKKIFTKFQLVY